eukprot:Awhi_evm1s4092
MLLLNSAFSSTTDSDDIGNDEDSKECIYEVHIDHTLQKNKEDFNKNAFKKTGGSLFKKRSLSFRRGKNELQSNSSPASSCISEKSIETELVKLGASDTIKVKSNKDFTPHLTQQQILTSYTKPDMPYETIDDIFVNNNNNMRRAKSSDAIAALNEQDNKYSLIEFQKANVPHQHPKQNPEETYDVPQRNNNKKPKFRRSNSDTTPENLIKENTCDDSHSIKNEHKFRRRGSVDTAAGGPSRASKKHVNNFETIASASGCFQEPKKEMKIERSEEEEDLKPISLVNLENLENENLRAAYERNMSKSKIRKICSSTKLSNKETPELRKA